VISPWQACCVRSVGDDQAAAVLARLASLRQHQRNGQRSPHKPLLVLLALGQLRATGSSALPWSSAETKLAELIAEFGPPSRTRPAQSAAYPFTRLRADKVWVLDKDVRMDDVRPLADGNVRGRFDASVENVLLARPAIIPAAARELVMSNFPETVAADVLEAWDRQCAFCGYDGQFGGASVGIEAAHVRWFAFGGPDALDNGLALDSLHHKLFDLGVLGLDPELRILVSGRFSARTSAGRAVCDMHGRALSPRPGTAVPAAVHVSWHARQVFKGKPLAA
jgi:putative restriction endonuclease